MPKKLWHSEPEEWTEGRGMAICDDEGIVAIIDPDCDDPDACSFAEGTARLVVNAPRMYNLLESLLAAGYEEPGSLMSLCDAADDIIKEID